MSNVMPRLLLIGCLGIGLETLALQPEAPLWALRLRGLQAQVLEERRALEKRLEDNRRLIQALEAQQASATDEAHRTQAASLLRQAQATLARNEALRSRLDRQAQRIQSALARARTTSTAPAQGWMLDRGEGVEILPSDGSRSPSDELRTGDTLRTGSEPATLLTPDGRGRLRLDPHSELQVEPEGYLLVKGKLRHAVQKAESFAEEMKALFQRYGEDLRTLWQADASEWDEVRRRLDQQLKQEVDRLLDVRTPIAVMGVRGTRYEVEHRDGRTKVTVTEGRVHVQHRRLGESREVEAGQSLELTETGWVPAKTEERP